MIWILISVSWMYTNMDRWHLVPATYGIYDAEQKCLDAMKNATSGDIDTSHEAFSCVEIKAPPL